MNPGCSSGIRELNLWVDSVGLMSGSHRNCITTLGNFGGILSVVQNISQRFLVLSTFEPGRVQTSVQHIDGSPSLSIITSAAAIQFKIFIYRNNSVRNANEWLKTINNKAILTNILNLPISKITKENTGSLVTSLTENRRKLS